MVSKNLPKDIKIVIPLKYRYPVGMSCERIFAYSSYYLDQYHSKPYMILEQFCLGMKVLALYINPHGIEYKNTVKYPSFTGIKKR
jgi:hypothetical protein